MTATPSRLDDERRLAALHASGLLDTPPDQAFDRLTSLAVRIVGVPVALVTLVDGDRQFFKSCIGLPEPWATRRETPLTHSFCQYTVLTGAPLVIEDAREHPMLRSNLAVPEIGVVAYAGYPLTTADGHVLGTFCAIDTRPRRWTEHELAILRDLAASVATEIELRITLAATERSVAEAQEAAAATQLLSDAGRVLALSLDLDSTLQAIARLAAPRLCDMAMVDLIEDGRIRRVAATHADERASALFERARQHPPALDESGPQAEVMRTGRTLVVNDIDDAWLGRTARNAEHAQILRDLAPGAVVVVPLPVAATIHGTLSLVRGRGRPPFGPPDVALAEELGRRAALAVESAKLFAAARSASRARDDLLGVVSHDLRNPIHTVFMSASFLLEILPPDAAAERTQAAVMKRAAERANRLIGDLLDITQLDARRMALDCRAHAVADVVDEAVGQTRMLAEAAGVALERGVVDEGAVVLADRDRLLQALSNLLGNALKFTPAGGRVTVSAREEGTSVRFAVADTGPGIAPDQRARLFDRFWQAQRKDRRGVGLGLSIVKGIAEAHGGEVRVESTVGEGSTFSLTVPSLPRDTAPSVRS